MAKQMMLIALLSTVIATSLAAVVARADLHNAVPDHQQPLAGRPDAYKPGRHDLIHELEKAHIIPTVLDTFIPLLTLSIFWENATAEMGNTINPNRLQSRPDVQFIDHVPDDLADLSSIDFLHNKGVQLTLALTDPDAPSRDNPRWSQVCHWLATGITLTDPGDLSFGTSSEYDEIMPYKPPGPPPKTGKHRYVFVALAPRNGTSDKLYLTKPGDRRHWGYDGERTGVREWAEENGLVVVGANFIYAQDEEQ